MKDRHKVHCYVSTCLNSSRSRPDLSFFNLPVDKCRRNQWLMLIGREDLLDRDLHYRSQKICEEHFSPNDIKLVKTYTRKMLQQICTPTLCLPLQRENNGIQVSTVSTGTSTLLSSEPLTPIKQDISNEPSTKKMRNSTHNILLDHIAKEELEILSNVCSKPEFTELIKCDGKLIFSKQFAGRFEDDRLLRLNLYYASSQSYNLLHNTVRLPNILTLFDDIPITTEINEQFISCLKIKCANMTAIETRCVVVVDSMPISPALSYNRKLDRIVGFHEVNGVQVPVVAEKALVLMARGMFVEWQQPVGYALISQVDDPGKLANWINQLMNKLCDIGLSVRVLSFACKEEADFFEKRWISIDATYFFVKKTKIYYISDPKMLLHLFRNDWLSYDIRYDNSRLARYEHIAQFYEKDKNSQYRLAPNLTDSHVYATESNKNDIEELFSKNVARGLSAYIDHEEIDNFGRHTAEFIDLISDLLSLFNDNKLLFSDVKAHVDFLIRMKCLFFKLQWYDSENKETVTHAAKSVRGFLININTYLRLIEDYHIPHLISGKIPKQILNQGMTENFFEQIRLRCNAKIPTADQFGIAFTQLCILNATKPLKTRKSELYHEQFFLRIKRTYIRQTTENMMKYMLEVKDPILTNNRFPENVQNAHNKEEITIPYSLYSHIDRSDRHTLMYVSGFLLKQCKEYHRQCDFFKNYADGIGENVTLNHFSRYLTYSRKKQMCFISIPCNHFVIIVEKIEYLFFNLFREFYINHKIEQTLCEKIKKIMIVEVNRPPCPCFPWDYFIKLFVKLRIAYTILLNNREIGRKQKDFIIPLLLSDNNFNKM